MERYKTMKEAAIEINPYSIEQQVKAQIQSLRMQVFKLERYRNEWGYIVENENGDFLKLEDVLNLFSAKKE